MRTRSRLYDFALSACLLPTTRITRDANDLVHATRLARKKPLLAFRPKGSRFYDRKTNLCIQSVFISGEGVQTSVRIIAELDENIRKPGRMVNVSVN